MLINERPVWGYKIDAIRLDDWGRRFQEKIKWDIVISDVFKIAWSLQADGKLQMMYRDVDDLYIIEFKFENFKQYDWNIGILIKNIAKIFYTEEWDKGTIFYEFFLEMFVRELNRE